jgi:CheY-like chemotaxis protein
VLGADALELGGEVGLLGGGVAAAAPLELGQPGLQRGARRVGAAAGLGHRVGGPLLRGGDRVGQAGVGQRARGGAVALELVEGEPPSLILLDMRMPVMDGWTFARAYRARPGPYAPILVLTAARDPETRAAEIQADGCLSKPFDLEDLLNLVDRLAARC